MIRGNMVPGYKEKRPVEIKPKRPLWQRILIFPAILIAVGLVVFGVIFGVWWVFKMFNS